MTEKLRERLQESVCLLASFDETIDADRSRGNATARINHQVVRHDKQAGRFGGALVFDARDHGWAEDEFQFEAKGNFPYSQSSFEGTVSLWLRGDPDADLNPEYPVDPFHISRHAADGSFYLDLTRPNDWRYGSPRKLRFGIYGDSPAQDMFVGGQLIVAGELGFSDGGWHHLAATWQNTNSGKEDARAELCIDGVLRGWMQGYQHSLTWEIDRLSIGLGQRYVGSLDELLVLDLALSAQEIQQLYSLQQPLETLINHGGNDE